MNPNVTSHFCAITAIARDGGYAIEHVKPAVLSSKGVLNPGTVQMPSELRAMSRIQNSDSQSLRRNMLWHRIERRFMNWELVAVVIIL